MASPSRRHTVRRSSRRRMRYDDDDDLDDIDVSTRNGSPGRTQEHPTTAGMIGFLFCIVSIALLAVVVVLYIFLRQEDQQPDNLERRRWMFLWFLFLDVLSFLTAMTSVVMGARGLAPSNSLYRGYATAALIIGILEAIATVFLGLFITCCGVIPAQLGFG